jgi:hypothetical protein
MKHVSIRILYVLCCFSLVSASFAAERPKRVKSVKSEAAPTPTPAPPPKPVTVLSIIPAQAEPGSKVNLSGSGFGETATVFLGSVEIAVQVSDARQAEFTLPPDIEAGLYALYLKRSDGTIGRTYNFTVLPLRPVLSSLQPAMISACALGKDREVTAVGANFRDASMLFLNGAVLTSAFHSSESISFLVPNITGGLHQIQVRNSPDNASVPLVLTVETRPEIGQITIGNEYVNYYELIVSGRNFQQNSSVYVDGTQVGGRGGQEMAEREKLIYVDCTKLIYQRHPFSPVNKDFRLQVVNPGGEGSQVITVTAP